MTAYKGNPLIAKMSAVGQETFKRLTAQGEQIGWHPTGSLGIARSWKSAEGLIEKVNTAEIAGIHNHEVIEDFKRVQEVQPFVANPDNDFQLAVYSPNDGIVNPADCTISIAKKAKA